MYNAKALTFALCTLLFCTLLSPLAGICQTLSPERTAAELQKKYSSLTSILFDFKQITTTAGRERQAEGDAVFLRTLGQATKKDTPETASTCIIRWNYDTPDKQIIVNDGVTLSIYTEKDKQMIVTPANEVESDITYSLLTGSKNILDNFTIEPVNPRFTYSEPKTALQSLQLIPQQPQAQIKAVNIWFDDSFLIHHITLEDHFDSITRLTFSHFKINTLNANDPETLNRIIHFPVPADTEIVRQQ